MNKKIKVKIAYNESDSKKIESWENPDCDDRPFYECPPLYEKSDNYTIYIGEEKYNIKNTYSFNAYYYGYNVTKMSMGRKRVFFA